MDIAQLEYFRAVAKLQNMTRAAEALYVTQPNLSISLTKLENELGIKLFVRRKGNISLTTKGEVFLHFVNKALGELNNGLAYLEDRVNSATERVSVASSIAGLLPKLIEDYTSGDVIKPYIHLLMSSEELYRLLDEERLDFAITTVPSHTLDVSWTPVREDVLMVLVPEGHAFWEWESVTIEELADERIVCNDNFLEKGTIDDICLKAGFLPDIVIWGNEFISARRDIIPNQAGLMLALSHTLPAIRALCPDTYRVLPVTGPFNKVPIGVVRKNSRPLHGEVQTFYEYAIRHLPTIIEESFFI